MHTEIVYATIYKWNAANQGRDNRSARARAIEIHLDIWKKNTKEFSSKMPQAKRLGQPLSASLRSPNSPGHQFYAKIIKSNAANQRQGQRACAIHMHLDVWKTILCKNVQTKCRRPISRKTRGADFARACAVEMPMDMSQKPFRAIIYRKKPANRWSTLINHRP